MHARSANRADRAANCHRRTKSRSVHGGSGRADSRPTRVRLASSVSMRPCCPSDRLRRGPSAHQRASATPGGGRRASPWGAIRDDPDRGARRQRTRRRRRFFTLHKARTGDKVSFRPQTDAASPTASLRFGRPARMPSPLASTPAAVALDWCSSLRRALQPGNGPLQGQHHRHRRRRLNRDGDVAESRSAVSGLSGAARAPPGGAASPPRVVERRPAGLAGAAELRAEQEEQGRGRAGRDGGIARPSPRMAISPKKSPGPSVATCAPCELTTASP